MAAAIKRCTVLGTAHKVDTVGIGSAGDPDLHEPASFWEVGSILIRINVKSGIRFEFKSREL
jgi:hypothetical protein